ncbi:MAG: dipeptidase [Cytophagales bacterium]|jgi:acetylornithine deacetylase/succinyl-diaminopimelate desuccinylase-like protein|nr:dipeptidase [Cytophagales bacterium]
MNIDLQKIFEYIHSHDEEFLNDLKELIQIPTINTHREHNKHLLEGTKLLQKLLSKAEIENIKIFDNYEKPLVYGEKILNPNYKTVLLYAHYDVQPVEPMNLWLSDPFTLTFRDEKMYGRGVSDDKGSIIMLIKAVESLLKTQNLRCNVKFIFEGGEEVGSSDFIKFLHEKENIEILKNDLTLICDFSILDRGKPLIYIGARGITCFAIKIIGANKEVHSGAFGGIVGNPIHALCSLINSFHDENNHISIENFYTGVENISQQDHEICLNTNFNDEKLKKDLEVAHLVHENFFLSTECIGLRPTLEVNGIEGGYTGEGTKTVIPSYATAKISCRLVYEQDPKFVFNCIKKHVEKNLSKGFSFEMKIVEEGGKAFRIANNSEDFKSYCKAFEQEYGQYPLPAFEGASVGVVSYLKELLNKNILLCGFSEHDALMHSPNENLRIENFTKGIKTLARFIASYN